MNFYATGQAKTRTADGCTITQINKHKQPNRKEHIDTVNETSRTLD